MARKTAKIVNSMSREDWSAIRDGFILVDSKTLGWESGDFVRDVLPVLLRKQKDDYGFSINSSVLNLMRFFIANPTNPNTVLKKAFDGTLVDFNESASPFMRDLQDNNFAEKLESRHFDDNTSRKERLTDRLIRGKTKNSKSKTAIENIFSQGLFIENEPFHLLANKGMSIIHDFKDFMDGAINILTINEKSSDNIKISFSFPLIITFKEKDSEAFFLSDAYVEISEHHIFNVSNIRMIGEVPLISTNERILNMAYVDPNHKDGVISEQYDVFIEFRPTLFKKEISLARYKSLFKTIYDGLLKLNEKVCSNDIEAILDSYLFHDGEYSCARLFYIFFMVEEIFDITPFHTLFKTRWLIDSDKAHLDYMHQAIKRELESKEFYDWAMKSVRDRKLSLNKSRITKYAGSGDGISHDFDKKPQIFNASSRYTVEKFRKNMLDRENNQLDDNKDLVIPEKITNSDDTLQKFMPPNSFKKLKDYEAGAKSDDFKFKIYSDGCRSIPFEYNTKIIYDIKKIKEDLDTKVYGLGKVKEHIVDYLAVMARNPDLTPPVICLSGPPGIGKTTICKTIAESINRRYQIISCSGMSEAFSISGGPFSYYSSKYGKIIEALIRTRVMNPLILLDEIDKSGTSHYNGNLQDALTTILDPEQNYGFEDQFLGFPIDISKIQFITTANDLDALSAPLRNRMSVIELPGYDDDDKFIIMKNSVLPQIFEEFKIRKGEVTISDDAIRQLIDKHGGEPGIREVKRVARNLFARVVSHLESGEKSISITDIDDFTYVGSETRRTIGFG